MGSKNTISILLNCHTPFVRYPGKQFHHGEAAFFQSISDTYIPLLQMLDRLDRDGLSFRIGIALSPVLSAMLRDNLLIEKYMRYVDRQIAFGERELKRTENKHNKALWDLAAYYHRSIIEKQNVFVNRYKKRITGVFNYYQQKGRMEILATMGTHCFIPFYMRYPENLRAQMEISLCDYQNVFGCAPSGFWLPELGYAAGFDHFLRAYNFNYTIIDAHTAMLAQPAAAAGCFYPLRSPKGTFMLVRDYYAYKEIQGGRNILAKDPLHCDYFEDIGYKLDGDAVKDFLDKDGVRCATGYRYLCGAGEHHIYNAASAEKLALTQASAFLERRAQVLAKARYFSRKAPVSLCAWDADFLGKFWQEGFVFLEHVFREGAAKGELVFATPCEYLCRQDSATFQTVAPDFSSAGFNGYGESFLGKANDLVYRHIYHAVERMIELSLRFKEERGLKAAALNQAARELLLSQSSDFTRIRRGVTDSENGSWDRQRLIEHLQNFTTLYESLGGGYLSTKLLFDLGKKNNLFPGMHYHIFRKQECGKP